MAKLDVFVSFRTTEARFADALKSNITRDFIGIPRIFVSTDVASVPAGSQWYDELLAGMRRAGVMLAICSRQSVATPWINYEVGGGCARGIDVIPLCHSGMTPEHLPPPLAMLQGVRLTEPRDLEKLYITLSERIGCDVPSADFHAMSRAFLELERDYDAQLREERQASERETGESIVQNPRVVCVSSQQYLELGSRNQIEQVLAAFPANLRHDIVTTAAAFEAALESPVEIVHIAAYVCPRSGTLYFSPVSLPSGSPVDGVPEAFIKAEYLELLLQKAGTKLVVIAIGDSLALAARLLPITNVISPRDMISSNGLARWVHEFYSRLPTTPLAEATRRASAQSQVPMRLLSKQVETAMKMKWDKTTGRPAVAE